MNIDKIFDTEVMLKCDVCGEIKRSTSWTTIRVDESNPELYDFVQIYGKALLQVCLICVVAPLFKKAK